MIRYSLVCATQGHGFDSWFRDSETYDRQAAQGLLSCPFCQSTTISKAVMAPSLARGVRRQEEQSEQAAPAARASCPLDDSQAGLRAMMRDLHAKILSSMEDVGEKFPQEACRIEDGDAEPRPIRGRATFEDAKALLEDGIEILPIPELPNEEN